MIRVRDNGLGIPADKLVHIFEMFVQVDRSIRRSQGGLGIGLTLVKSLVEMHGGIVEVHSDGPDQGSEFVVRLPVLSRDGKSEVPSTPEPHGEPTPAPLVCRLLVVDDNRDAADSLAILLRLIGQEVRVVYDGPTALEAARAEQPEVAFLDIGMPGMDGCELARRFRQEAALRHVTLVALTGWGQEEDRRRSQEAGFDHHLIKPADLDTLRELLSRLQSPA